MASENDPIVGKVTRGGATTPGVFMVGTPDPLKQQEAQARINRMQMLSGKYLRATPEQAAQYGQRFGQFSPQGRFEAIKGPTLSEKEKTELINSEGAINRLNLTAQKIKRAFELNDTAYGGALAGVRQAIGSVGEFFGSEDPSFKASQELDSLLGEKAIGELRERFPGAISDAETKINMALQGNTTKTPAVRARIWQNMLPAINSGIQQNMRRIQAIKGGYYQRAGVPTPPSDTPKKQLKVISVEDQ